MIGIDCVYFDVKQIHYWQWMYFDRFISKIMQSKKLQLGYWNITILFCEIPCSCLEFQSIYFIISEHAYILIVLNLKTFWSKIEKRCWIWVYVLHYCKATVFWSNNVSTMDEDTIFIASKFWILFRGILFKIFWTNFDTFFIWSKNPISLYFGRFILSLYAFFFNKIWSAF